MPRLLVATLKRVIILERQGFSVRDIQCRLVEEEGVEVSLRSLQREVVSRSDHKRIVIVFYR